MFVLFRQAARHIACIMAQRKVKNKVFSFFFCFFFHPNDENNTLDQLYQFDLDSSSFRKG